MDQDDPDRAPVGGPMSERMQALLARAAEEQLTEQRQVSVALTDLRQLVTGQGEAIDRLVDAIDALSAFPGALGSRLEVLEQRLGAVAERLADVGDAAGGVPAVAVDVGRLVGRLEGLTALPADVAGLREDVQDLSGQVAELAPRVADLVLTRVAATLVAATSDSEQRISAHVDEAVLALAEALLRRRRDVRAGVLAAVAPGGGGPDTVPEATSEAPAPGAICADHPSDHAASPAPEPSVVTAFPSGPPLPTGGGGPAAQWYDQDGSRHRPWWRTGG